MVWANSTVESDLDRGMRGHDVGRLCVCRAARIERRRSAQICHRLRRGELPCRVGRAYFTQRREKPTFQSHRKVDSLNRPKAVSLKVFIYFFKSWRLRQKASISSRVRPLVSGTK